MSKEPSFYKAIISSSILYESESNFIDEIFPSKLFRR